MKEQLAKIRAEALSAFESVKDSAALDELRVRYLGKKGELTAVLKQMGRLSAEERPAMGALANEVRAALETALDTASRKLEEAALEMKLKSETVDVTIPGKQVQVGHQHPMNAALEEMKEIFIGMGFTVLDGPEIELSELNFDRLNAEDAPAHPHDRPRPGVPQGRGGRHPLPHVPPGGGHGHRQGRYHGGSEGHPGHRGPAAVRPGHQDPFPPPPLPLHRALLRNGRAVPQVRRQGLPHLQGRGLD